MSHNEIELYNLIYTDFMTRGSCRVSCYNLDKARKKVAAVLRRFNLQPDGALTLDIGCGLGYFSEAFREMGAEVLAIDSSPKATEIVQQTFPKVDVRHASFPQDCPSNVKFDIIWSCDFSLLNTLREETIDRDFIHPALNMLAPDGTLIIGWHTDFSGTFDRDNWAHWSLELIQNLKKHNDLLGPFVNGLPKFISTGVIQFNKRIGRSIPIFLCLRKHMGWS